MLLQLDDVSLRYGAQVLAENVSAKIERGDRICLVGRNGEGKSSLLRLIAGDIEPDEGEIVRPGGIVLATLGQELPSDCTDSVYRYVAGSLGEVGLWLADYRAEPDADLQTQIEAAHGWELLPRIESVIDRLGLDGNHIVAELSGGWQRRAALARALVTQPDLLILDEPTNHLDISAVEWLENFLGGYRGALLFVSHDRALAQRLAKTVWDLDRGHLRVFRCDFDRYQREKEKLLEEEARSEALFDKKLAQEEAWIRQGIKARRTRNEGRVRALQALRRQREARRNRQGSAKMALDAGEMSGKLVAELTDVSFAYPGEPPLIRDLSFTLMRGDKVGLIGPNGVGKSTLIRILLGELQPGGGKVRLGTKQQVAYFDQRRQQLNPELTVLDNIAGGRESISIGGKSRHAMSYLADFLFSGIKARTKVGALSGGERNRALLAKLFSQPANILVLDEPTNDLDVETLELLEQLLLDFPGTVLLVSHDRAFLDNVVDSCLAFEGGGIVREYVGGYADFLRQGGSFSLPEESGSSADKSTVEKVKSKPQSAPRKQKLSYKLQRELDSLPGLIEQLEGEIAELESAIAQPDFYQREQALVEESLRTLAAKQAQLDAAFERWAELDGMAGGA
ncbi:ATP-binding cassette domain-containing protein [Microbulbifer thermotolerans]|uniref:ATP-binding cassette domain-containing protein n=1 Tax=Microbulbifer thermotolerans TaxID=252514 RepID=UPI0022492478|nr:ATP-binding cassette domain-containing protein [Microbulbifer thermotolerans]MCX2832801.1 ATP-binding cassette domain-containing protein [Microbulbifer thermotolerans]